MNNRFLTIWDCAIGKPLVEIPKDFKFQVGDFFTVINITHPGIKLRPMGADCHSRLEEFKLYYFSIYSWTGTDWELKHYPSQIDNIL